MGWDNELLHYTNNDNPFGDSNLLGKFVWKKKLLKEGISHSLFFFYSFLCMMTQ